MRRLAIAVLLLPLVPVSAWSLDIPGDPSSCGIVIQRGDPGILQGDLDCTGQVGASALSLGAGAKLHLNGFRISGGRNQNVDCWTAVSPSRTCTIEGPGELTGAPIGLAASSRARVRDVIIHGNGIGIYKTYGDVAHAARLDLDGVTIRDNTGDGIRGGGAINAKDTTIRDNGGVGTTSYGPSRLVRTTITGNGGSGIVTGRYSDFYEIYFYTKRLLALVDSDVSGNGVVDGGVDVLSGKRPRVLRTTCGTSADPTQPGNPTWGVCSND